MPTQSEFETAYRRLARILLERPNAFACCEATTLDEWVSSAALARVPRGEVLARRNEVCESLLLLVEGALEVSLACTGAKRHLITFALPGMIIGYLALADGGPNAHDLVAHLPSVVCHIPLDLVRQRARIDFGVHAAVAAELARRSRLLYEQLTLNTMYKLPERLAHKLLQLLGDIGYQRDGCWMLDLLLPQADLADLLGGTRQSVNAELRALQAAGVVKVGRRAIAILDLPALRARCAYLPPAASGPLVAT